MLTVKKNLGKYESIEAKDPLRKHTSLKQSEFTKSKGYKKVNSSGFCTCFILVSQRVLVVLEYIFLKNTLCYNAKR